MMGTLNFKKISKGQKIMLNLSIRSLHYGRDTICSNRIIRIGVNLNVIMRSCLEK